MRPSYPRPVSPPCAEVIRTAVRAVAEVGVRNLHFERSLCAIRGAVEMALEGHQIMSVDLHNWRRNALKFLHQAPHEQRSAVEAIAADCLQQIRALRRS